MSQTQITVPEVMLVAGTRAALGAGLGLLLADHLSADQRRAVGWTLVLVGVLSTIPLAFEVFGQRRSSLAERREQMLSGFRSETNEILQGAFAEA